MHEHEKKRKHLYKSEFIVIAGRYFLDKLFGLSLCDPPWPVSRMLPWKYPRRLTSILLVIAEKINPFFSPSSFHSSPAFCPKFSERQEEMSFIYAAKSFGKRNGRWRKLKKSFLKGRRRVGSISISLTRLFFPPSRCTSVRRFFWIVSLII